MRLPPAINEYRIDSQIKSVCGSGLTTEASKASKMAGCLSIMYLFKSNSVAAGAEAREVEVIGVGAGIKALAE